MHTRLHVPCHSFTPPSTPAPLCLPVSLCVLHDCALHGVSPRDRWLCDLPVAIEREREEPLMPMTLGFLLRFLRWSAVTAVASVPPRRTRRIRSNLPNADLRPLRQHPQHQPASRL